MHFKLLTRKTIRPRIFAKLLRVEIGAVNTQFTVFQKPSWKFGEFRIIRFYEHWEAFLQLCLNLHFHNQRH